MKPIITPTSASPLMLSKFRKLLVSAQFWVLLCLLALMMLPLAVPVKWPLQFWFKQGFDYLLWAGTFYLNSKVIVPRVVFKGKILLFVFIVVIIQVILAGLSHLFNSFIHLDELIAKTFNGHKESKPDIGEFIRVIVTLIIFGISTVLAVAQRLQSDEMRKQRLEKEKTDSELSFLKTQINPHFFFNVLHTIYALMETDTPTAKDSVYTLSHMMRYVLYDTKNDMTTLEKELTFLEDYIKLMQLRLTENVQIVFDKPKQLRNVQVAPMLILPFIENAFKHGISTVHPSYIYVGIKQHENTLAVEVRNSLLEEKADHLEESNGIGLLNTQRRLDLLYPEHHELTVERNDKAQEFIVTLKLSLS